MKALVIGGTGPTGPHVVEGLLERGYETAIFHTGAHEHDFSRPVEHIHGEARSAEDVQDKLGDRQFDVTVSMYGRLRYIAQVMRGKTKQFIGITGPPYLGFRDPAHSPEPLVIPIAEDAPKYTEPEPSLFSHLIYRGEMVVMEAHKAGAYSATLFRYPRIYGPRQVGPTEWSIVRRILDGRKRLIVADAGLRIMDRCGARNAAQFVLLAVDHPAASGGQAYNVQDDWVPSVRQWIDIVSGAMNHQWEEIVTLPYEVAKPAWVYMRQQPHHTKLDNTKAKRELGYSDVVHPRDGFAETVKWLVDTLPTNPQVKQGMETNLGDPFDYATEDRMIEQYHNFMAEMRSIPYELPERVYSYAHGQSQTRYG